MDIQILQPDKESLKIKVSLGSMRTNIQNNTEWNLVSMMFGYLVHTRKDTDQEKYRIIMYFTQCFIDL